MTLFSVALITISPTAKHRTLPCDPILERENRRSKVRFSVKSDNARRGNRVPPTFAIEFWAKELEGVFSGEFRRES